MSLPKLNTPSYSVTLPSTGKQIKYRPFLVKEEKILLLAQETGSPEEQLNAIKELITVCTYNALDINTLTDVDIQYLMLMIRAKSVGEVVELSLTCREDTCKQKNPVSINLMECEIVQPEISNIVMITDSIGIKLRHLRISDIREDSSVIDIIQASITEIFDAETVYHVDNTPEAELREFVESIPTDKVLSIQNFISTKPRIILPITFCCKACKTEQTLELDSFESFFG